MAFEGECVVVSVIIPTYNRCAYIEEAIKSVLSQVQATDAMEVIVVDDGSRDGTLSILESFGPAIQILRPFHGGVSAARNRGIEIASGKWIAFLDSDDLWLPRKLATQLDFLRKHPEIQICQTQEIWLRNGKHLNPKKYHEKPSGHCFHRLLERCLISPSAVIIAKEVFKEVGLFDESLPACEDYDLWLRVGCRYPIGLVEEPLVVKRGGHPDQLSATTPALDRFRIQALSNLLLRERLEPKQRRQAIEALRRKCLIYGEGCKKRGRVDEGDAILALLQIFVGEE